MAKQSINVGAAANDRQGDSLRSAFQKVNANFTELYTALGLDTAPLNLGAFTFTNSVISTEDSSDIVIDRPTTVNGELVVDGDITPKTDLGASLGTAEKRFQDLYLSGNTIFLGTTRLSVDLGGNLLVGGQLIADVGTAAWANITGKPTFADVATSGSYDDLSDTPTIPTDVSELTDVGNTLFDGDYSSLSNVPTIPTDIGELTDIGNLLAGGGADTGNFSFSANNITASSGAAPILLKIFGGDAGDPPALISREWSFNTNGSITFPDGTTQTSAYTGGGDNPFDQDLNTDDSPNFVNMGLAGTAGAGYATLSVTIDRDFYIGLNDTNTGAKTFEFGRDGRLLVPGTLYVDGNVYGGAGDRLYLAGDIGEGVPAINIPNSTEGATSPLSINNTQGGGVQIETGAGNWLFDDTRLLYFPTSSDDDYNIGESVDGFNIRSDGAFGVVTNFTTDAKQWTFGDNGILNLPNALYDQGNNNFLTLNNGANWVVLGSNISEEIQITTGGKTWQFNSTGSLQIPGDIRSENAVNIDINLSDSTLRRWTFGEDGDLTLPTGYIKPSTTDKGLIIEGPTWANWVPSPGGGGGYASISNGVNIVTHRAGTNEERVWSFSGDGALYAPFQADNFQIGAIEWRQTAPYVITNQIRTTVGNGVDQFPGLKLITLPNTVTDDVAITLGAGFNHNWIFKNDGSLQLAGDIKSEGNINIDINLSDSTLRRWTFGEDGILDTAGSVKLPANRSVYFGDAGFIDSDGTSAIDIYASGSTDVIVQTSEGSYSWIFKDSGYLRHPGELASNDDTTIVTGKDGTPKTWTFGEDGDLTAPGVVETQGITATAGTAAGTIYTFNANYDSDVNPATIQLSAADTGADQIAADWIITYNDGVTTATVKSVTYTEIDPEDPAQNYYELEIVWTTYPVGNKFPLTVQSPDYETTDVKTRITAGDYKWRFDDDGDVWIEKPLTNYNALPTSRGLYRIFETKYSDRTNDEIPVYRGDVRSGVVQAEIITDTNTSAFPGVNIATSGGAYNQVWITANGTNAGSAPYDKRRILLSASGGFVDVDSVLRIEDGVQEKFQTKTDATGVVAHDYTSGHIFYHTSPDADWTINLTNLNLASGYATTITIIIEQGNPGFYPSALQIGGAAQTINWQGNTLPTPSISRTDVVTFSIFNNSGTYTVLGQLAGF